MTWLGAVYGLSVLVAAGIVVFKSVEPAPTRPRLRLPQSLVLPTLGVLGVSMAWRSGPFLERYGLLAAVLLAGLAEGIEFARAVRRERQLADSERLAHGESTGL